METKWVLEIYDNSRRKNTLTSAHEFNDFPSLRTKIVENRGGWPAQQLQVVNEQTRQLVKHQTESLTLAGQLPLWDAF